MKRQLLITEKDAYSSRDVERLSEVFEVHQVVPKSQLQMAAIIGELDPDVLMVGIGYGIGGAEVIKSKRLKLVISPTTGIDHLNIRELEDRGVQVITLRDMKDGFRGVSSTAELAWALVLALARRLVSAANAVSAGEWQRERFLGQQLRNKTLGIVGLGRLGGFVAQYGLAFGMQVVATDTDTTVQNPEVSLVTMKKLLPICDVISIHVPLDSTTQGMIGIEQIREMKKGVLVVNTSRGEVVDESAIASALRSGHLGGYGTDVISGDSGWAGLVQPNPITELMGDGFNVVATPHIGGYSHEAVRHTRQLVVDYVLSRTEFQSS